ncbi:hypothetical protein GCM10023079_26320 [Streptomyces chitinivorans]
MSSSANEAAGGRPGVPAGAMGSSRRGALPRPEAVFCAGIRAGAWEREGRRRAGRAERVPEFWFTRGGTFLGAARAGEAPQRVNGRRVAGTSR